MGYLDFEESKPIKKRKKKGYKKRERRQRKIQTHSVLCEGAECPHCHQRMERRKHKEITDKVLKQSYYFSQWDFCKTCNHVQHYDKYKVYNKNEKGFYSQAKEEERMQVEFLRSL